MKMKKAILYISVIIIALWIMGVLGNLRRYLGPTPKQREVMAMCMSNLYGIGLSTAIYAMDHKENFPETFVALAPEYAVAPRIYLCPSDCMEAGSITNVDEWSSYVLIPLKSDAPEDSIQAFCPPDNHNYSGGNVLLLDGSIEWKMMEDFKVLFEKDPNISTHYQNWLSRRAKTENPALFKAKQEYKTLRMMIEPSKGTSRNDLEKVYGASIARKPKERASYVYVLGKSDLRMRIHYNDDKVSKVGLLGIEIPRARKPPLKVKMFTKAFQKAVRKLEIVRDEYGDNLKSASWNKKDDQAISPSPTSEKKVAE